MSVLKEAVKDKQRILFLGMDAGETLHLTSRILNKFDKAHESIRTANNGSIGDAPMVLIENRHEQLEHHTLVVGKLSDDQLNKLEQIADQTPKAGSIVYSSKNKEVKKICEKDRTDVTPLPYKEEQAIGSFSGEQIAAVKMLLAKIGISENQLSNTFQSLF